VPPRFQSPTPSSRARRPFGFRLATAACLGLVAWGWNVREETYFTAASGPGYALGIAGTAMMVGLLLYSLRKRLSFMRSWGPIQRWFAIHMMLGVLGPVAILFHANFRLGSLNSTIALACVLVVASSGLVGRFIYPKVNLGLSGRRASLTELRIAAEKRRAPLGELLANCPALARELSRFEAAALALGPGARLPWRLALFGGATRRARRRARRALKRARLKSRPRVRAVNGYLDAVRRVAEYTVYDRIFSLWHAFHLPLCGLLFAAAALHVIAVHMY
jgi:hypothetical protein